MTTRSSKKNSEALGFVGFEAQTASQKGQRATIKYSYKLLPPGRRPLWLEANSQVPPCSDYLYIDPGYPIEAYAQD